jgi:hypothetical protein
VQQLIRANSQLTVHEISAQTGIAYGMCQAILTEDLNMQRVSAKSDPFVLTIKQKERCLSVANEILQQAKTDLTCREGIITGDETWVYRYDRETESPSSQWNCPSI